MRTPRIVCVVMAAVVVWSTVSRGQTTQPCASRWKPTELLFVTERESQSAAFGMVMICPSHAHGTLDEAYGKLVKLLTAKKDSSPSTIWVCRSNLFETLRRFGPLVDRVCVNPFVAAGFADDSFEMRPWIGTGHPVLRHMRKVLDAAGETPLLACLDLGGDGSIFAKRLPDFEELRWQVCAVLGSGFKGIVWRGRDADVPRFSGMLRKLDAITSGMARALPANDAKVSGDCPVSVWMDETRIYVVALHSAYLTPRVACGMRTIALPVDPTDQRGSVEMPFVSDCKPVLEGAVFSSHGRVISSGGKLRLNFTLNQGGDIFIVRTR